MEMGNMQEKLSRFLLKYCSTPHSTMGVSPSKLLMNQRLRTRLDLMYPNTSSLVRRKQETQKKAHNHHAKDRHFEVSNSPKSWQKGTVVQATGPVSALVELEDGQVD